ncbi:hypothetical protein MMC34_002677 [Xylographa carneopallida]|nr:hypothetical protein [Xylographa carneopallida]
MAPKYQFLYLLLQPLITPLSAQLVNSPITAIGRLSTTSTPSTTPNTFPSSNATILLQSSPTSTFTTEDHYVGPSAVRFTSDAPLNAPISSALKGSSGPQSTCSGIADPNAIYITSTIVVAETITLSDTLITPTPIYITPIPLCSKLAISQTFSNGGPGGDTGPITGGLPTGPINIASKSSTILVTKKTPVIILQTPSPTQDLGSLAKTLHLVPAPVISTPGAPDAASTPTPSSVLAAIVQSIFNSLASSPTTAPALPSEQNPPNSLASQPGTDPQPGETSPSDLEQPNAPTFSTTIDNIPLAVFPSAIIIGTQTFAPPPAPTPITIAGQTFTLAPSVVLAPSGLILPLPAPIPTTPAPTALTTTIADLPLTLYASSAVLGAETYVFAPGTPPLTTTIGGQVLTLNPSGIVFPSTTLFPLPLPAPTISPQATALPALSPLLLNPTLALLAGVTIPIGPNAPLTTLTLDGQPLTAGPGGLILPSTTILPPEAPLPTTFLSAVSVDGLVLSLAPGKVLVSGTEYAVGSSATATETLLVGGQTLVVGPGGVVMAGTTVAAPTRTGRGSGGGDVLGRAIRQVGVDLRVAGGVMLVGAVWLLGVF